MRLFTINFSHCFDFLNLFENTSFSNSSIKHFIKTEQFSTIVKITIQNIEDYIRTWKLALTFW